LDSTQLAQTIARLSLDKKAEQVKILDLREITTLTDYFVICNGTSDVQIKTISDYIVEQLKSQKIKAWHVEGLRALNWVLIDFVDVIVHIFMPDVRHFYALEKLWGDAIIIDVNDESGTTDTE
jgi:ribosome-associated protein